jgi:hypothetical protein
VTLEKRTKRSEDEAWGESFRDSREEDQAVRRKAWREGVDFVTLEEKKRSKDKAWSESFM